MRQASRYKPKVERSASYPTNNVLGSSCGANAQFTQISGPACSTSGLPHCAQIPPSVVAVVRHRAQSSYRNATVRSGWVPSARPHSVVVSPGSGSIRCTFLVLPIRTGWTIPRQIVTRRHPSAARPGSAAPGADRSVARRGRASACGSCPARHASGSSDRDRAAFGRAGPGAPRTSRARCAARW
jgi:hypothetical protein